MEMTGTHVPWRRMTTNLQRLRPSRKRLIPGDIFALRPPGDTYLFGRVVRTDAICLAPGAILIYVYRTGSPTMCPPAVLSREELLIPPILINRLPWSRGYFETVENRPLREDAYERHCFRTFNGQFYDEYRNELRKPIPGVPIGDAGLHSYRTVDDAVSEVLGIPLAPD